MYVEQIGIVPIGQDIIVHVMRTQSSSQWNFHDDK